MRRRGFIDFRDQLIDQICQVEQELIDAISSGTFAVIGNSVTIRIDFLSVAELIEPSRVAEQFIEHCRRCTKRFRRQMICRQQHVEDILVDSQILSVARQ